MALVTSVVGAGLLGSEKNKSLLGDQEYYDKFIRPEEEALRGTAQQQARGAGRGFRIRQGQFASAQGLGGSQQGQALVRGTEPIFRRALQRSLRSAQMRGEELRRQKFAERDRRRAEIGQAIGTTSSIESTIGSAILGSNPITAGFAPLHSGITAGAGLQFGAAQQAIPVEQAKKAGTYGEPLQAVNYDAPLYGEEDLLLNRTRGGGGADFYRTYGF